MVTMQVVSKLMEFKQERVMGLSGSTQTTECLENAKIHSNFSKGQGSRLGGDGNET